jgi:ribosomal protein S18 acetylase RimI-like enzyme
MTGLIRLALPGDRSAVVACVTAAFEVFTPQIGKPPAPMLADYAALIGERRVHLLEERGAVLGALVTEPRPDHLFVDVVAVRPAAQRRGIGRRLMAFAEAEAARRGLAEVRLYTHEVMSRARPVPGARLSRDRKAMRGRLRADLFRQARAAGER